jgi:hypothetical protein
VVTASNRAGMAYCLPGCELPPRVLAERLDPEPAVEVVLFREGGDAVARREADELRFRPEHGDWTTTGDVSLLDHPQALERAWAALANPLAGDVLVSAAEGFELTDLGGRHHEGGGSHGSLVAGDSFVPVLSTGLDDAELRSITDVAPTILRHFGVEIPKYARRERAAA